MPGPFMPNNLPKIPHIDQLAAGWAGIEILTLVLRFAAMTLAGNRRAEFAEFCLHAIRTFNLPKKFRNHFSAR